MQDKQKDWSRKSLDRQDSFRAELIKLCYATNRSFTEKAIAAKSALLQDTLKSLPNDQIEPFFKHLRDTEESFPADGKIRKVYQMQYDRYGPKPVSQDRQLAGSGRLTREDRGALVACAQEYPVFEDLFQEACADDTEHPTEDWQKRFWQRMMDPRTFGKGVETPAETPAVPLGSRQKQPIDPLDGISVPPDQDRDDLTP